MVHFVVHALLVVSLLLVLITVQAHIWDENECKRENAGDNTRLIFCRYNDKQYADHNLLISLEKQIDTHFHLKAHDAKLFGVSFGYINVKAPSKWKSLGKVANIVA